MALIDGTTALRNGQTQKLVGVLGWNVGYPLGLVALLTLLPAKDLPLVAQVVLALAVVVPMGPLLYRLVFQPIASAPVLILLIVSVAVHVAMRSKVRNKVSVVSAASRAGVSALRWRNHTQARGSSANRPPSNTNRAKGAQSTRGWGFMLRWRRRRQPCEGRPSAQRPGVSHQDDARSTRSRSRLTRPGSGVGGMRIINSPIGSTR